MKYYVTYKIDARYIAEVEAENIEDAKKKAEDIDGEQIIVEDNNGDYVWEK